jgi:hypothetical protein
MSTDAVLGNLQVERRRAPVMFAGMVELGMCIGGIFLSVLHR